MFDAGFLEVVSQLSPLSIAAIMVILAMRFVNSSQAKSGELQETVLGVLNRQMENENKRDEREVAQLEETRRHNKKIEEQNQQLAEQTKMIAELIRLSTESSERRHLEISTALGTLHQNQEEIKQGVMAMSTESIAEELKKLTELFASLDKRVAKLEERLPVPTEPPAEIPTEQEGTPTRKLAPPTAFPAEDGIEDVPVNTPVDNKDND